MGRRPSERRIQSTARSLDRRIRRLEPELRLAQRALDRMYDEAAARFGREVPRADAFLLDVLAQVDVVEGDAWLWRGVWTTNGLPSVRVEHGRGRYEVSAVRYIAVAFGVIGADDDGLLYPLNGVDDVNPWHRQFRAGPHRTRLLARAPR